MRSARLARVALPLLAGLAVIAALAVQAAFEEVNSPRAEDGEIDLSGWGEGGAFELAGEWEFYWGRLLTAGDIRSGGYAYAIVEAPGEWTGYETDAGGYPGKGKATYRLRVTGARPGAEYGMRIQNMASAYRLYADGRLITQNGGIGDGPDAPASAYRPQLAVFTAGSAAFDIVLQISNDAYAVGGMWEPVVFGTAGQAAGFDRLLSFTGALSLGSLAAMCVFMAIFFAARRMERELLILAGIGVMVIARLSISGDMLSAVLFPRMPISGFGWIDYLSLLWIQFFLLYYVYCSYPCYVRKWQIAALLAFSAGVSLFVMLVPFEVASSAYWAMNIVLLIAMAAAVVQTARAAYGMRAGAPQLLGAMSVLFFTILYESFFSISSTVYYVYASAAFNYLLLFFVHCTIVARRYSRAQETEMSFLKKQIHPHFIHNALATIISISRADADRARALLAEFSSYLRGFYDFDAAEHVPLSQELEFIRAYAALEQARFGEKYRVEYHVEDEGIVLPPLILQPLVENAFVHGLREKEGGGTVTVYARKIRRGIVRLGVRDDGVGMGRRSLHTSRAGVGISNINQRLTRLYRTQLTFSQPEGGGCDVWMDLPLREGGKHEGRTD